MVEINDRKEYRASLAWLAGTITATIILAIFVPSLAVFALVIGFFVTTSKYMKATGRTGTNRELKNK